MSQAQWGVLMPWAMYVYAIGAVLAAAMLAPCQGTRAQRVAWGLVWPITLVRWVDVHAAPAIAGWADVVPNFLLRVGMAAGQFAMGRTIPTADEGWQAHVDSRPDDYYDTLPKG